MKIRTRIALALALCLAVAGIAVLLVNEAAIESAIDTDYERQRDELYRKIGVSRSEIEAFVREHPEVVLDFDADAPILPDGRSLNDVFEQVQVDAQQREISSVRRYTALAIVLLSVGAGLAGWFISRRVLRPVRLIADRANAASASDLRQRVALDGPNDEMKELSNTFDDMLDRLERSFEGQRRFAAQVSHELRTPLTVIRAEAELLLLDDSIAPDQREACQRIRAAGMRADHLIESLLALSRAESDNLTPEAVALDELVGDIVAEQVRGDEWSTVRVEVELADATVLADAQLLECVVVNLLDNAAKYNGDGGSVSVCVSPDGERPADGLLVVENQARPSDVTAVRSALQPDSVRAETSARGHGIGLSVVAMIVQALDGRVRVGPDPDRVRVEVRLPAAAAASA